MGFADYMFASLAVLAGLAALVMIARPLSARLVPGWSGSPLWLATAVLAIAIALLTALFLGTFGLLYGWLYLVVLLAGAAASRHWRDRIAPPVAGGALTGPAGIGDAEDSGASGPGVSAGASSRPVLSAIGLAIASLVFGLFAVEAWQKLGTGMTGFDSTWYHGPFAAGFAASGDTFSLHYLAPQFLSWFYPQNSELIHSLGILGFGNDLISPLLNLGWLAGCLVAAWAIGRPYRGSSVSTAGVALVLGSAAMADQAGEARNDIFGIFFILTALAILFNAAPGGRLLRTGPLVLIALSAGMAAGTKINLIPAAIAIAVAAVWLSEAGRRSRAALIAFGGLAAGGAYWYLRNLIQSGNPLPWVDTAGPFSLPGPDQELGGRDAASVLSYLSDPGVIDDWFFPGLADGFGDGWALMLGLALAGIVLCLWRGSDRALRAGAAVGLALLLAWIAAPTSASGPAGEPEGFVSGLRYLAPALAVGLALLGGAIGPRDRLGRWMAMSALILLTPFVIFGNQSWSATELLAGLFIAAAAFAVVAAVTWAGRTGRGGGPTKGDLAARESRSGWTRARVALASTALAVMLLAGYVVQDRYFDNRYASPEFTTAGLSEAFVWARGIEGESIATNATRQYPLFGTELDNEVQYLGVPGSHGGFVKPDSCEQFRDAVARGDYRYLVLTLDRENLDRPFTREIPWIEDDPNAVEVLRTPPTVIYELEGPLDPATCP